MATVIICSDFQFSSVAQLCLTLCDPMNRSMPCLPVHHQLLEFTQTHVHWVSDAIQPSHPPLSPSPPAPNPSQQWFWSPPNTVSHCFHCFPIYLHKVMAKAWVKSDSIKAWVIMYQSNRQARRNGQICEMYDLSRLNQEEIENTNGPITGTEI